MSFIRKKCRVIGCEKEVRNKGLLNGKTKYGTTCEMHHRLKHKLSPEEKSALVRTITDGWVESRTQLINGIRSKRCSSCKKILPIENFRKDAKHTTGLSSQCKKCKSELYDKIRYKNGREKYETDFLSLTPTGVHQGEGGYRFIFFKEGITIPEHRWVIMKALGRPLKKWEYVHHKNKNRADNRLENLELTPFAQEHEVQMHEKSSLTSLIKENEKLRKRIKDLEKNK